ncbi:non-hydrolyzing UDP-N-acetylglucosamine 2-epimerase [uncultured Desulfosarcina sp.]|uniref:non-hydrolyzing UDP-N-acetylglucosamine 2-epimerase n=1 Tax=uncultured Desulfosarcina sp. TaxID=218289 RepID=UPI0029C68F79|nr:UDP-N-acetylglucosamine 2-epimerase (non-hydrolyzing) [uncultured Desulfosarcina sp.]
MMKILSVVGARPNFMKIAPFVRAIKAHNRNSRLAIDHLLLHTGQHYDDKMSRSFFQALGIPEADINLGIGSGTHAEQVGQTMIAFEKVVRDRKPDWIVVVGDVNATCACSITAKKENVRLAHIEAGLRSGDMTMPEEVNRLVTDRLSDLLLTPDRLSSENLRCEGVPEEKIRFVGNIMIDTLEANLEKAAALEIRGIIHGNHFGPPPQIQTMDGLDDGFAVLTLHRPSNVDEKGILGPIVEFLVHEVTAEMPLLWTVHPRTANRLKEFDLLEKAVKCRNLVLLRPLGYHQMLRLNLEARMMLTDSGGLQEECCVLGTPCLTMRWNTERPITLKENGGASVLVGNEINRLRDVFRDTLRESRQPVRPELWDGKSAPRIVKAIVEAA